MYETEQTSHERRSNDTFNVSKFQDISVVEGTRFARLRRHIVLH